MINLQKALRGFVPPETDWHRAERFNRDMARREAKNFYWGFISLGRHERMAIYALYNFARQVDDEADGGGLENLPDRLKVHRERIARSVRGDVGDDPIMHVLAEAIAALRNPRSELLMLIDGVEMDFVRRVTRRGRTHGPIATSSPRSSDGCACGSSVLPIRSRSSAPTIWAWRCSSPTSCATSAKTPSTCSASICRRTISPASGSRSRRSSRVTSRPGGATSSPIKSSARASTSRAGTRCLRYIPRRPAACVHTMAGIYEELLKKIERDPALPLRERAALSKTEKLLRHGEFVAQQQRVAVVGAGLAGLAAALELKEARRTSRALRTQPPARRPRDFVRNRRASRSITDSTFSLACCTEFVASLIASAWATAAPARPLRRARACARRNRGQPAVPAACPPRCT